MTRPRSIFGLRIGIAALVLLSLVAATIPSIVTVQAPATTPGFTNYVVPAGLPNRNNAGEPSIGANWVTGKLLYQAYTSTYKITLDWSTSPPTASWVTATPLNSLINLDPILFTDSTLGRTWAGGLLGACSQIDLTDNESLWLPSANPCSGTVDHETIGAGPWSPATPVGAVYPHAVYYCAQLSKIMCATSLDGGLTFLPPVPVLGSCGSLHGHVKVSSQGNAFLPSSYCAGVGGGISLSNGLTWFSYTIPSAMKPLYSFDPSVGTTKSGWVYQAWQHSDNHMKVALSKNNGTSWMNYADLSTNYSGGTIQSATMPAVVAGNDTNAAVAFLGTLNTGSAFQPGFSGSWDLFVATTYDAGVTWTTVKATTNPVQKGWICTEGIDCSGGRNLLDFIDATIDAQGRIVVAYADGCTGSCATGSGSSTSALATIAVQTSGSPLL